ncbi:hypothetical protein [Streptomyces sp. LN785]|uniref:hypothetical protein n=1 Tax=Streptomyces sp. LN785 TaxID=3112983 RepID=UPI0037206F93
MAVRLAVAVLVTWIGLTVLLLAPAPLPEQWRYYIYSPASVGLWMLSMFLAPIVVCAVRWRWIKSGSRSAPSRTAPTPWPQHAHRDRPTWTGRTDQG